MIASESTPPLEVMQLAARLIARRKDARPLDQSRIAELKESISEIGLLNPITVRKISDSDKPWQIIAGGHRQAACELLGMEHISCLVVEADDVVAELVMIDENLCRQELTPAARARQIARRKELYEQLHPETKRHIAGGLARHAAAESAVAGFAKETAKRTGRAERTIRQDAMRGEAIGGDHLRRVQNTALDKGVELDALAALSEEAREELIQRAEQGQNVSAQMAAAEQCRASCNTEAATAEREQARLQGLREKRREGPYWRTMHALNAVAKIQKVPPRRAVIVGLEHSEFPEAVKQAYEIVSALKAELNRQQQSSGAEPQSERRANQGHAHTGGKLHIEN
jgi:ParB/RepB/Spo0J family partition protein